MIGVDMIGEIRRAYFEQHRPIKEIVRTLSVSRATVRKVIRGHETEFKYERGVQPAPKLGEWVEVLTGDPGDRKPSCPSGSAARPSGCSRNCAGADMTAPTTACIGSSRLGGTNGPGFRSRPIVPMSFAPGEAYQFDWSHETITLQGLPLTIKAAHMKLSHSRMPFVRAYFRETQELVFDAHDKAFAFYGGVCRRGIYDNMKTAVEAIFVGKARQYNRRFLQMCSHHLIEPVACTPASGWEKGQVENQVGNLRDQLFRPKPRVKSLAELNAWLEDQCIAYAQRTKHPEFKDRTIWEVFQDERASLMELRGPFDGFVEKAVRASTTCLIMADHNRYSVDARAAGRMVLVRSHAERIVVLLNDEVVADHPRQFRRDQIIYDPWHYLPVLMKKPGALRNGAPFKDWDLPPAPDPGPRQAEATRRRRPPVRQGAGRGARSRPGRGRGRLCGSAGGGHRQWRCDPDRAGAPAAARAAAQHHHARCAAPEDRTRGRLWPLRQHKEDRLMERHEILEAMSELKLYGMRASFDEIAGKGLCPAR